MPAAEQLKPLLLGPPVWTLAAAESLTCGHVQARIGSVSGASGYFLGGITAYTLDEKVRHLGVTREHAAANACVSEQVAREMARGACLLFGSDLAVATTGFAEQPPPGRGVGPFAWWAIAHHVGGGWVERSGRIEMTAATRVEVQAAVADGVLSQLIEYVGEARRGR